MTVLEQTMEMLCAEYVDIDKTEIRSDENPELLLISKEAFVTLSEEARDLVNLIMNAPDRLYHVNGQLKKIEFQRYCKRRKGWGIRKLEDIKFELSFFCRAAILR